jgi:hypothetical protein
MNLEYMRTGIAVSTATRYSLDGPGSNPGVVGARFSAPVQNGPGAHPASYTMGTGSLPEVKRPGRGVDQPLSYSAETKERVQLYIYSHSGLHGLFYRVNFALLARHTGLLSIHASLLTRLAYTIESAGVEMNHKSVHPHENFNAR